MLIVKTKGPQVNRYQGLGQLSLYIAMDDNKSVKKSVKNHLECKETILLCQWSIKCWYFWVKLRCRYQIDVILGALQ